MNGSYDCLTNVNYGCCGFQKNERHDCYVILMNVNYVSYGYYEIYERNANYEIYVQHKYSHQQA